MKKMGYSSFVEKHLRKGFQFCVVGSFGAVLSLTLQYILVERFNVYFLGAAVIAILVSMVFNYFLNYYWTFREVKE